MSLIKKCVCGNTTFVKRPAINDIELLKCQFCGVLHQSVDLTNEQYQDFYKEDYHNAHQRSISATPYFKRYKHDVEVSKKRLYKYNEQIRLLDIGCGNAAFVNTACKQGYDAYGVDLNSDVITGNRVYIDNLLNIYFPTAYFDTITMHDVFEHIVDPIEYIHEIKRILKPNGRLIIDFPDYFTKDGKHHWRPIQHLWYFEKQQLKNILTENGFSVIRDYKPIAGKFVLIMINK
jgi:ubiquinone/menaquinone biosynthesis C-methylase UbiE